MKRDMRKYILRKLVELIFTLLFVTLLSFLLMRLSSVDPATAYAKRMIGNPTAEQIEKIRIQLGFDKPLLVQYGRWVWDLLHFDLGISLANGHDVWTDIDTPKMHKSLTAFFGSFQGSKKAIQLTITMKTT